MYRGRNGTVAKLALCAGVGLALSGCVQATRHSNAIVFGTNTSMGVNVGTGAASVPTINIGYNRQEAVFLPLLANTREVAEIVTSDNRQLGAIQPSLSPCNIDPTHVARVAAGREGRDLNTPLSAAEIREFSESESNNPCLFVARRTVGNTTNISDAYSVFASFGGRVSGGQGTGPRAALGVAQYFATGVAAQIIASEGGALITSVPNHSRDDEADPDEGAERDRQQEEEAPEGLGVPAVPPVPPLPAMPR